MDTNASRRGSENLQFDRMEPDVGSAAASPAAPAVQCKGCGSVLTSRYFAVNGAPVCGACQATVERSAEAARSTRTFARATLFGLGAAILGAVIYYGVIALTGFEIGIVAILTGYLVGRAVRRGAMGHGSRRLQVLAAAMTYFSVGLAYMPIAVKAAMDHDRKAAAGHTASAATPHDSLASASDSAAASASAVAIGGAAPTASSSASPARGAAESAAPTPRVGTVHLLPALLGIVGMILFLPVLVVVGSMPSGLLSALIIAIGIRQAWRMTAGRPLQITGPFRIGDAAAPATA